MEDLSSEILHSKFVHQLYSMRLKSLTIFTSFAKIKRTCLINFRRDFKLRKVNFNVPDRRNRRLDWPLNAPKPPTAFAIPRNAPATTSRPRPEGRESSTTTKYRTIFSDLLYASAGRFLRIAGSFTRLKNGRFRPPNRPIGASTASFGDLTSISLRPICDQKMDEKKPPLRAVRKGMQTEVHDLGLIQINSG
jgi:hypothetical protein